MCGCVVLCADSCVAVLFCAVKMVAKIKQLVSDYEKRLHEMPYIPSVSYGRRMLLEDSGPNRDFLSFLFCCDGLAMQFLKDVGLLRNKVQCDIYGRDMTVRRT